MLTPRFVLYQCYKILNVAFLTTVHHQSTYVIPLNGDRLPLHDILRRGDVLPIDKNHPHQVGGNAERKCVKQFLLHHGNNVSELTQQSRQH